ncbi:hypothetical protein AMTRI_Chr07g28560 [Amborella trichopoda]
MSPVTFKRFPHHLYKTTCPPRTRKRRFPDHLSPIHRKKQKKQIPCLPFTQQVSSTFIPYHHDRPPISFFSTDKSLSIKRHPDGACRMVPSKANKSQCNKFEVRRL